MKRTTMFNQHVSVAITEQIDEQATAEARMTDAGAPAVYEAIWTLTLTDRASGDQVALPLAQKGRDGLIRDLQQVPGLAVPAPRLFIPGS